MITGPTSHSFISQRLKLRYVDWGNPDAPPLILLHGGRDHARSWDWTAETLRARWHVIAPDLRGHGDSDWSADGDYGSLANLYDLAQLIHQLKLAPVTIVAHSYGGNRDGHRWPGAGQGVFGGQWGQVGADLSGWDEHAPAATAAIVDRHDADHQGTRG